MKIKEAKQIIGCILDWQFVLMGIKDIGELKINPDFDIKKYSLDELILANKKVRTNNILRQKISERKNKGSHTTFMICADRLIAAVYVALNFDTFNEGIAIMNNVMVGVFKTKDSLK